jgi:pimeloyl-ACP methyl ester carboxylesterase
VRLEIIDGRRRTDLLRLPPADCILNRLVRLLEWLARKRPDEGWGAFLREDAVRWEQVAVAGHSQGGGHAALMGKQFPLARVVMLGAPADAVGPADEPAPWLNRGGPTPPERYFGFAHGRDPGIERILAAWNRLDMNRFGPVVNVDGEAYPYHGSHCLITDLEARGGRYHGSVAVDRVIPRYRDGTPAYREVWRYLFALGEAVR